LKEALFLVAFFLLAGSAQAAESVIVVGSPKASPDGKRIVFSVKRDGVGMLDAMDADGTHRLAVPGTQGASPAAWSADGRRLVFTAGVRGDTSSPGSPIREIVTMNVDGSERRIIASGVNYQSPAWSPDGTRIAFSTGQFPRIAIHSIAADGSDDRQLTHKEGLNYGAAWSPDGKTLVFVSAQRAEHRQGRCTR